MLKCDITNFDHFDLCKVIAFLQVEHNKRLEHLKRLTGSHQGHLLKYSGYSLTYSIDQDKKTEESDEYQVSLEPSADKPFDQPATIILDANRPQDSEDGEMVKASAPIEYIDKDEDDVEEKEASNDSSEDDSKDGLEGTGAYKAAASAPEEDSPPEYTPPLPPLPPTPPPMETLKTNEQNSTSSSDHEDEEAGPAEDYAAPPTPPTMETPKADQKSTSSSSSSDNEDEEAGPAEVYVSVSTPPLYTAIDAGGVNAFGSSANDDAASESSEDTVKADTAPAGTEVPAVNAVEAAVVVKVCVMGVRQCSIGTP